MLLERTEWISMALQPPSVEGWYFTECDANESWISRFSFAKWDGKRWWRALGWKSPSSATALRFSLNDRDELVPVEDALLKQSVIVRYQGLKERAGKFSDANWHLRTFEG